MAHVNRQAHDAVDERDRDAIKELHDRAFVATIVANFL